MRFRSAAVDLTALTGFWLLFFWPIIVARDHLIPYDLIDQHYMYQAFVHRALVDGDTPWWTPNILSGYPIVADPITALFYPPNLLMHLLTPDAFLPYLRVEFLLALHFHWAAIGTYFLGLTLTRSRAGAILAALIFAYGAFFAWHMPHLSPISSLSWLPWVLLCVTRAWRLHSMLWTALGAAAFGALVLAGHALTIVYVSYLIGGLTVVVTVDAWRRFRGEPRRALVLMAIGATVVALGMALAAVQVLPALELSGQTARANFTWADASASSYRPHWLVTAVVPNFFAHSGPGTYWASGDPAETNSYVGLLPLVLAALAVARARAPDRRVVILLLAGTLFWLIIAFGSQTWLYRALFEVLPGFDRVRRPGNAIAVVHLGVGLLAAFGVRSISSSLDTESDAAVRALRTWLRWILVAVLGASTVAASVLIALAGDATSAILTGILDNLVLSSVIALVAYLVVKGRESGRITVPVMLIGLIVIAAFDVGAANAGKVYQHHTMRPDSYVGRDWAGSPVDSTVRDIMVLGTESESARPRLFPSRGSGSIWANGPLVWDVESIYGYSVLWPTRYQQLFDRGVADPNSVFFDMLGTRYVVLTEPMEFAYPGIASGKFRLLADGYYQIWENVDAWDRAWVVPRAVQVRNGEALDFMLANPHLMSDVVVLDELPRADAGGVDAASDSVDITEYSNSRVKIDVSLAHGGYVVLGDTWYPGWQATVNGEPTHVYRANHALRAVWVPAGTHSIVFDYQPSRLRTGAIVSSAAAIVVGTMVGYGIALGGSRRYKGWRERRR